MTGALDALPGDDDGEPVTVRPATAADAPALLALYERHYGAHPGGFVRSLPEQEQRLLARPDRPDNGYALALDGGDRPCGYLKLRYKDLKRVEEAGVDSWPAARALLRYHRGLLEQAAPAAGEGAGPAPEAGAVAPPPPISWGVPPRSATYYYLADHLLLATEVRSRPRAGWLARPAHLPALFRELVPALAARWRRATEAGAALGAAGGWSGRLGLHVAADEQTDQPAGECVLELDRSGVSLAGGARGSVALSVRLTPGAFTQLIFGFRPVWWIARQPGNDVPTAAAAVLDALFPAESTWIAASDGF